MINFVHLRTHSEYSITDSTLKIKDLVALAKQNSQVALALTDRHNLFGLVKFYTLCRKTGIKPIIGSEVNISNKNFSYQLILLAKNLIGYQQINQLISRSYIENKQDDIPYIKEEWLFQLENPQIIILAGFHLGDLAQIINKEGFHQAQEKLSQWTNHFKDNYYLEVFKVAAKHQDELFINTLKLASIAKTPIIATHPIQFATPAQYTAHEVRVCIAQGETLDNSKRVSSYFEDQYFKSSVEMAESFKELPLILENTLVIAQKCNLELTLGKYFLPDFNTPDGSNLEDYLTLASNEGLEKRLSQLKIADSNSEPYHKRLNLELKTIIQMGFAGYFLIVADFISWAKNNHVPVGPGRGSGAGSLVAFSLEITDIDPLRYNLLFERFLNPERVSMPDFDIDFCQDKRELVIQYVQDKYGIHAVSQIATFGTMASRAVIKDVGRALSLPYGLCDSISKLIENTPAKSYSLKEAFEQFPDLKAKINAQDEEISRLWELSLQLEDLPRSVGKHAAGVLIAPSQLTDFCPIYLAEGMQTSQLDKDDVEKIGLVKFDFLGLRNLTIIEEALQNIYTEVNQKIQLSSFEFNDPKVYKTLAAGNTTAIFQLESSGMKRLLIKLEPNRFEDIIAVLALYRPGPLGSGMVDDFVKRKKGEAKIDYFHPDLKECLEPTYGVIVYQEQVMQISQIIGGYTLGGADLLRRAMGKKKPEEMAHHREIFIKGALNKGYNSALAEKLFDLMAMFAEYGFNKSHTAAYAVISYHTAYLKTYYPAHFMAATLSSELDKTDKLYEFYLDCKNNNLEILPPDINSSYYRFKATNEDSIRYALGAIKGVGEMAVNTIIEERNTNGNFTSFLDFCERVDKKILNKKTLEGLIKAGAFDKLEPNRAKLLNNLTKILDLVFQSRQNTNQASLFEDFLGKNENLHLGFLLDDYPEFSLKEKLALEKQALGFYLSASLFDEYQEITSKLGLFALNKFNLKDEEIKALIQYKIKPKPQVLVGGIIKYLGTRPTKKGGKIAFVKIEDGCGELELTIFNDDYEQYKVLLKPDELIFVEGEVSYDNFRDEIKVNAHKIFNLNEVLNYKVTGLKIQVNHQQDWNLIKNNLALSHEGSVKLNCYYVNQTAECEILFGESFKYRPDYTSLTTLSKIIGHNNWKFQINEASGIVR